MTTYDLGDKPEFRTTITDYDDSATDPDTVTFTIKDPSGNIESYVYGDDAEVVQVSTGIYYVRYEVDEVGAWYYEWNGSGTLDVAEQGSFDVRKRWVAA